jgi:hypothetical protein
MKRIDQAGEELSGGDLEFIADVADTVVERLREKRRRSHVAVDRDTEQLALCFEHLLPAVIRSHRSGIDSVICYEDVIAILVPVAKGENAGELAKTLRKLAIEILALSETQVSAEPSPTVVNLRIPLPRERRPASSEISAEKGD